MATQPQVSSFIIRRGLGRIPVVETEVPGTGGGSGGGLGGGSIITQTEYIDRPMPKIRLTALTDDTEIENKEIWVINIKDFDSL